MTKFQELIKKCFNGFIAYFKRNWLMLIMILILLSILIFGGLWSKHMNSQAIDQPGLPADNTGNITLSAPVDLLIGGSLHE